MTVGYGMLPLLLLMADIAPPGAFPSPWAQFSRSRSLVHVTETVDIATADKGSRAAFRYRMRLTRQTLNGALQVRYADSAKCPAIQSVISSMKNIKVPAPAPFGSWDGLLRIRVHDGIEYSLSAPSSDSNGQMTISSNLGSPLAAWVDTSLKKLELFWIATPIQQ
jgi:hypothetical protein